MRRVSISSGFSKLWCVCFFLRSFAICLFVCLFFFVRFEKCRTRKKGRKEERHHHHPTTRSSTTHKKAAFFGEEKAVLLFFGRSRSLGCLRLNARGRSDYFLGRLAHGGVRGVRPGTRRPRTHGGTTRVFSSLFRRRRVVSKRRIIHRSIDRPVSSRVIGHRARAGVTTLQSRAARRTETRGRRSRRSHALKKN